MELSRRRLLGALGAGAAGLATGQVSGQHLLGTAAGAGPLQETSADPPEFRTRLTERYGMRYPIVQAGFSALYVTPELTAAVSNAGGLGCLGAAPEPAMGVRNLIRATKELTSRPFGMDFVYFPMAGVTVWGPDYENDEEHRTREFTWTCTDAHIDACIEEGIAYVVFFWTPPEARWVKRLKAAGVEMWAQVGSVRGALEAVDWGAEVIIAQGMQAGGHNRGYADGEPSLRQELTPRIKDAVPKDILVLGAGGVADGRTLAACLREGAEAAWVGTIFAASEESYAHEDYKRRVVEVKNGWVETAREPVVRPGVAPRLHPGHRQPGDGGMAGSGGRADDASAAAEDRPAPARGLQRPGRDPLRDAEVQPDASHPGHHRRLRGDVPPGRSGELPLGQQGPEGVHHRRGDGRGGPGDPHRPGVAHPWRALAAVLICTVQFA